MRGAWRADYQISASARTRMQRHLALLRLKGDLDSFSADLLEALTTYRMRLSKVPSSTQQRSAQRYLQSIVDGEVPRAWTIPTDLRDLLRSHEIGYGGDSKKAAHAVLQGLKVTRRGRPPAALNEWLIEQASEAYKQHIGASVTKNSKFAKRVLPIVFQAAGVATRDFSKPIRRGSKRI